MSALGEEIPLLRMELVDRSSQRVNIIPTEKPKHVNPICAVTRHLITHNEISVACGRDCDGDL
jgi:hypothetical protein